MLNPWLTAKLALIPNSWPEDVSLSLIVETAPGLEQMVMTEMQEIAGVRVGRRARNYVEAMVPLPFIRRVSNLTGVFMAHYNMPRRIMQFEPPLRPTLSLPFLDQLVTRFDPLTGYMKIDDVVVPRKLLGPDMLLPFSPMRFLSHHGPLGEYEFIPTIRSRDVLLDVPTTYTGRGVTVAVLDTGFAPLISTYRGKALSTCATDPQPLDGHGHGAWCASAAVGSRDVGPLGTCLGVAPEANLVAIKVLNGVFGFGTDMDIIAGIARAVAEGARVISMSLGGDECQGGCLLCPQCTTVRAYSREGVFFTIAVGNSGPKGWSAGCPGCSPEGISVGSVSLTDYPQPAYFSSRGPQNPANADIMEMNEFNRKPDVLAPGGGKALAGSKPDELIYSGEVGWMRGIYSGLPDPHDGMHGTCVAHDTLVFTPDGPVPIKELRVGDTVYSLNGHLKPARVNAVTPKGEQRTYLLRTRGKAVKATSNHPFLAKTSQGVEWVPLERLAPSDVIVTSRGVPTVPVVALDSLISLDLAYLLGYLWGDGWMKRANGSYSIAFAPSGAVEEGDITKLIQREMGISTKPWQNYSRVSSKRAGLALTLLGFSGGATTKVLPSWVFHIAQEKQLGFIRGLMRADGCAKSRSLEIANPHIAHGIAALCEYVGLNHSLVWTRTRNIKAPSSKEVAPRTSWAVEIGANPQPIGRQYGNRDSHLRYTRILDIESGERGPVYDIEVAGHGNFVANGIVVHNSQATPHVAGLVACLLEGGRITTPDDFKAVCSSKGHAKTVDDGWGVVKLSWFL